MRSKRRRSRPAPLASSSLTRDAEIAEVLRALAEERGPQKSFCPSEAAQRLSEDWRPLMGDVRRVGAELGLKATQKGQPVDPLTARGPIRFQLDSE